MSKLKRAGTKPELALRSELHRRGLRFRVNVKELPGRPDVAFTKAMLAVFVDGCFWHGCELHGVAPKANSEWWARKLEQNRARDARNDESLRSLGWLVVRVWEHDDPVVAADEISRRWAERTGRQIIRPSSSRDKP